MNFQPLALKLGEIWWRTPPQMLCKPRTSPARPHLTWGSLYVVLQANFSCPAFPPGGLVSYATLLLGSNQLSFASYHLSSSVSNWAQIIDSCKVA